jgi:hypothetical protein
MSNTVKAAVAASIEALRRVNDPRYFAASERGFQGWFAGELQAAYRSVGLLRKGEIVELENQKLLGIHGMRQRPDIVIHAPRDDDSAASARQGNLAVYALKRGASKVEVREDLEKLAELIEELDYPIGFVTAQLCGRADGAPNSE